MSWHDKKLEPLKVGDKVRRLGDKLEGEVVYVLENGNKYLDCVSINVDNNFIATCFFNGRILSVVDSCEHFFYIYERDGKPYPLQIEEDKTYIDEDGVAVLITKQEILYHGIRNGVTGFYTANGVSLATGKEIIKKKD